MHIHSPRSIATHDRVADFDCSEPALNDWIAQRAIGNESSRASRTFVTTEAESGLIAGYVTLAAGSLDAAHAPGRIRRNQPNPIPTILIGRLAVDRRFTGKGIGAGLLAFALSKGLEASLSVGARAFIVDALSDEAVRFYEHFGFERFPGQPRLLFLLTIDVVKTAL